MQNKSCLNFIIVSLCAEESVVVLIIVIERPVLTILLCFTCFVVGWRTVLVYGVVIHPVPVLKFEDKFFFEIQEARGRSVPHV